ncbi:hypothetical protein AK88_05652 [Plasmodium fragile]|uniref:Uncharacterized protein n=1 Tax=Plasmodium fragile TaxID=5857 RepID=A0A0D9QG91_PLAFR|nr:uncharacterized protein AK88_05652 [Plasmodium fragile]KJP84716.1 hypothetical protein AK88_05652 [Plasmodium fragile]
MDSNDANDLGANCDNVGWFHPKSGGDTRHVGYTVGDKVICKLMATALWFLTDWTHVQTTEDTSNLNNVKFKEYVKCAIVTMFASILEQSACGGTWAIYNAWTVMNKMWADGIPGLSIEGECKELLGIDLRTGQWSMKDKIKDWLRQDKGLKQKISGAALANKCRKVVGQGDKAGEKGTTAQLGEVPGQEEAEVMKTLQERTTKIVKLVRKKFRGRISGATGNSLDQTAEDSEEDDEDDEDDDEEDAEDDADGKNSTNTTPEDKEPNKEDVTPQPPQLPSAPQSPPVPQSPSASGPAETSEPGKRGKCEEFGNDYDKISACLEDQEQPTGPNTVTKLEDEYDSGKWGLYGSTGSTTISIGTSTTTQNVPTGTNNE